MTEPMKGVVIMLVAFVLTFFMVKCADAASNPSTWGDSPYVETGRFETTKMTGVIDNIVTDTKTGCQYMVIYQSSIAPLGCFPQYKKPESK